MRRLLIIVLALLCSTAEAGNDDELLLGNDAALTGGAVTATVLDGSAVWYNPAGLAAAPKVDTLDVSASAFVLRLYDVPELLTSETVKSDLTSLPEFVSVPTSLTYVRELSDTWRAALGVFVTRAGDLSLQAQLTDRRAEGSTQWLLAISDTVTVYHAGGSIAWAVTPDFRVGVSLLGVYAREELAFNLSGGVSGDGGISSGFITETALVNAGIFGLRASGGFQWDVIDLVHVGFSVLSPAYQLGTQYSAASSVSAFIDTQLGGFGVFAPAAQDEIKAEFREFLPPRIRFGIAIGTRGSWIALDGDVQPALRDGEAMLDRKLLFNARLGGRYEVVPGISIGAGVFTDLSPNREPADFGEADVEYVGGTFGVQYESAHTLAEEERDRLTFSTTIAIRYAYGWRDLSGLRVPSFTAGPQQIEQPIVDMNVHEVGLHLGSALFF